MSPVRDSKTMYYTYILQSKKTKQHYTGATDDLRKRFKEHNEGKSTWTKGRGPFILIYYEACLDQNDAFTREKYLKSGFGKRFLQKRLKRFLSLTG
jgi:putative endonuclease